MEAIAPILLAMIGLIPIGAVVGVAYAAHMATRQRAQVWAAVAAQLGLAIQGEGMVGALAGQRVAMRKEQRSHGKSSVTYTVYEAYVSPPFDLGLSIREKNLLSGVAALFGQQDVATGNAVFDDQFLVQGDEPARIRAALTPEVQGLLRQLAHHGYDAYLSDVAVRAEVRELEMHAGRIQATLQLVATLGAALERARSVIPVAAALAPHRDKWAQYAKLVGLRGLDCPLCMWGELEGLFVQAYAVRAEDHRYHLEVRVKFDKPLGVGLSVQPKRIFDNLATLFGGQDVETGDAAFDRAFIVKSTREDLVPHLFDESVRATLLELNDHHPIYLFDDGVTLRSQSLHDPSQVPRLIAKAKGVLEDIRARAARGGASGPIGPYR